MRFVIYKRILYLFRRRELRKDCRVLLLRGKDLRKIITSIRDAFLYGTIDK